jgi:hypothetical protein
VDDVTSEMVKCAVDLDAAVGIDSVLMTLATLLNGQVAHCEVLIRQGILVCLPKTGKPVGPCVNLRPVTLLTTFRKLLSMITLTRAEAAGVDRYVPETQHGSRKGRGTAEVVFTHRILSNLSEIYKDFSYFVLSIDLSLAYDCPTRGGLLAAMTEAVQGDNDVLCLTELMLSHTTLKARMKTEFGPVFETRRGTPQGDSFSPKLFTVFFEFVMRTIRPLFPPRPARDAMLCLPSETQYVDDIDFISTSSTYLCSVKAIFQKHAAPHKLLVNDKKTTMTKTDRTTQITDADLELLEWPALPATMTLPVKQSLPKETRLTRWRKSALPAPKQRKKSAPSIRRTKWLPWQRQRILGSKVDPRCDAAQRILLSGLAMGTH